MLLRRYVAEQGGALVGYAQLFQIPWLREPGRCWLNLRVDPSYGRRGIGGQLYQSLLADLHALGAATAWIGAHESAPEVAAALERRGFRELLRSWPFVLDTRGFELARFQQAIDRVAARGITITTLADERERDPDCLAKLYELHTAINREIPLPGHAHPDPGLAWFERYCYGGPLALPEAYFIAKDGARYAGESSLERLDSWPDELHQKTTGVHGDYRGYGIAVALKLATIAYAQQQGYARIWTAVESNNPSMLAINAKLGFVQEPGMIVFEKQIGEIPMTHNPKRIVAEGYDEIAQRYLAWSAFAPSPERMQQLARLLDLLPPDAVVLELGCGAGVPVTQALAERSRVTGVDISAEQIALAERYVPDATFLRADMTTLDFAAGSFDAVVSFYCAYPRAARGARRAAAQDRGLAAAGRPAVRNHGRPRLARRCRARLAGRADVLQPLRRRAQPRSGAPRRPRADQRRCAGRGRGWRAGRVPVGGGAETDDRR